VTLFCVCLSKVCCRPDLADADLSDKIPMLLCVCVELCVVLNCAAHTTQRQQQQQGQLAPPNRRVFTGVSCFTTNPSPDQHRQSASPVQGCSSAQPLPVHTATAVAAGPAVLLWCMKGSSKQEHSSSGCQKKLWR
jgi:hypothetical protein